MNQPATQLTHAAPKDMPEGVRKYMGGDTSERINRELLLCGISARGLHTHEAKYMPKLIHDDEHIHGVVYGKDVVGSVMLVATDQRIIFIDRKPFFTKSQDISYDVVGGVGVEWLWYHGALTLNTRFGDYKITTFNLRSAEIFRDYIERQWLEANARAHRERAKL